MSDNDRSSLFQSHSVPENYRRYLHPAVFAPWADRLVEFAGLVPGQTVLDVASGTGAVARVAARAVGPGGRVIASDVSPGMLEHLATDREPGAAPTETLVSPATELARADGSVDVVLCQQGLQFVRDKVAAVAEMRRVLRPGGQIVLAVWIADRRLEPFDSYGETLRDERIDEPFPHAWDSNSFKMSADRLREVFEAAGVGAVEITSDSRDSLWPAPDAAANGILGTPYGPAFAALDDSAQRHAHDALIARFTTPEGSPRPLPATVLLARARV
jgi:SAM-dependent methyltransferase